MDTFGWDTVYMASIDSVNAALARNPSWVQSAFSFSLPAPAYQGAGVFAPWQIIKGGAGQLIHLRIPIASGSLSLGAVRTDLSGISAVVEVALQMLPAQTPGQSDLKFTMNLVGNTPGNTPPGTVTPILLEDPANRLTFEQKAIVLACLAQSLCQNGQAVGWVLATVNPITGSESWLSPQGTGFCYFESALAAYLVILGVTTGRDISALVRQVDPALVDGSPQAAFAISKAMFLANVIQPILPATFGHGATAATFRFDPGSCTVVNTGSIGTDSVKSGAIWYDPTIEGVSVAVQGADMLTSVHGSCGMGMGITMSFGIQSRNATSVNLANGNMSFAHDPNPSTQHDASIPWYDWFLGPLPDAIMALVVPAVANGIASGLNDHAADLAVGNAPPPTIRWSGLERFQASSAGLNECFFLRGQLA